MGTKSPKSQSYTFECSCGKQFSAFEHCKQHKSAKGHRGYIILDGETGEELERKHC